ncbi:hypothetical protein Lfu02_03270 [Longispora fulva]|nr:hypothetical protein Lfu02_03270 [Longispora fulva]
MVCVGSGCSNAPVDKVPTGVDLLVAAADAMAGVKSFRFTVDVTGATPSASLQHAEGVVTHDGSATGVARKLDVPIDINFVIVSETGTRVWAHRVRGTRNRCPIHERASTTRVA